MLEIAWAGEVRGLRSAPQRFATLEDDSTYPLHSGPLLFRPRSRHETSGGTTLPDRALSNNVTDTGTPSFRSKVRAIPFRR